MIYVNHLGSSFFLRLFLTSIYNLSSQRFRWKTLDPLQPRAPIPQSFRQEAPAERQRVFFLICYHSFRVSHHSFCDSSSGKYPKRKYTIAWFCASKYQKYLFIFFLHTYRQWSLFLGKFYKSRWSLQNLSQHIRAVFSLLPLLPH